MATLHTLSTLLLLSRALPAAYFNLNSTSDGAAVFLEAHTSLTQSAGFRVGLDGGRPALVPLPRPAGDISDEGTVTASTSFGERACGAPGSTCFLSPACSADYVVSGPGTDARGFGRRTTIRLNRRGDKAWFEQTTECPALGVSLPPPRNGLYPIAGSSPILPGGGALANAAPSRRMITNRDEVLMLSGDGGLQLVGAAGARAIKTAFPVERAVIDADGNNIVYRAKETGRLRWIDVARQAEDDLVAGSVVATPVFGSDPALSDDGTLLAFLSETGLVMYRRDIRTLQPLRGDGARILEFAMAGNGRFLFAVTESGRLLRINGGNGAAETWLEPSPDVEAFSAAQSPDPAACPVVCYGPKDPVVNAGAGALLVLRGSGLGQSGLRVTIGELERPLEALAPESAWFQVPSNLTRGRYPMTVQNPKSGIVFRATVSVAQRSISCFGSAHQPYDRLVSAADPPAAGEVIHVFLTGLRGQTPIADGEANPADRLIAVDNPPVIVDDDSLEPVFFGLAPTLVGVQVLDVRVLRAKDTATRLFPREPFVSGCVLPPFVP